MKRKIELIMALILLVGVVVASRKLSEYVSSEKVTAKTGDDTVVLDAGHGGADPGKVGINDKFEKDLNLQIAMKVQKRLEDNGIKVIMTRTRDEGLHKKGAGNKKIEDMKKRVAMINESLPPLAISIHQNSYHEEGVKGAQVFYYSHSTEGEASAKVLQESLRTLDPDNTRQAKANDTYYLLKKTKAPTIIVECGFLSNLEEAGKLDTDEYQDKIADAITAGVQKYLNGK